MSIEGPDELEGMRAAGQVVAETIRGDAARGRGRGSRPRSSTRSRPRVRTRRRAVGAELDYGFPGTTCISVNDEAVHGIPGPRRLRQGDLVKLDVTAVLDGFYADACLTVPVGKANGKALEPGADREAGARRGAAGWTRRRADEHDRRGGASDIEARGHRCATG